MDWYALIAIIIMIFIGGILFFLADALGYVKWSTNPEDLECEECETCEECPDCNITGCEDADIIPYANKTSILNVLCEVCPECEECIQLECINITKWDLDINLKEFNMTGWEIHTVPLQFLGNGLYQANISNNHTIKITVNSTGAAC